MVQLGIRISEFYEHESCGKCTPCREGTRWMTQILRRLEAGDAEQHELDLLLDVCDRINGKCLCPLGETAAIAVASYVDKFRGEFQQHVDDGECPFGDSLAAARRPRAGGDAHALAGGRARDERLEPVKLTIDGDRGRGAEGHGPRRGGARGRDRDSRLLLRAAARRAGRRMPHVPVRDHARPPKPQAACTLQAADGMVVKTALTSAWPRRHRTRRSSSSSSTIRSTAPSATRAASARCRT
jgi:hypothetical protein